MARIAARGVTIADFHVGEAVEPGGHLGFELDRPPGIAAMLLACMTAPERGASFVPLSCHFGRLRAVGNGGQRRPMDGS